MFHIFLLRMEKVAGGRMRLFSARLFWYFFGDAKKYIGFYFNRKTAKRVVTLNFYQPYK